MRTKNRVDTNDVGHECGTEQEKNRDNARNSVQVNAINLTMSREQIATWKANRRKLVRPLYFRSRRH